MTTNRFIHLATVAKQPDPFQYDNQTFYDDVRFGSKRVRDNIRNRHRQSDFIRKRSGLQKLTRVRIVDNSKWSQMVQKRNPVIIHVYTPTGIGNVGDMVLLTISGHLKKALIVGQRQLCGVGRTRSDTNNVIILDDNGAPEATRITVPLPAWLRGYKPTTRRPIDMSKVLAIATSFV